MRIKKLELIGFKSFKDRTVIQFDHGITGIVGPNGCGKSNIVDALVWVMGEMSAKHLRGASMEDVIFAGADGYAPVGMAEVSLTLENDGGPFPAKYLRYSEIMVTRRLYRNGESEYNINKEPARLRDIQEIFMDTGAGSKGFSIIEQGAIGKIITAKPEDRRTLIEEAAGITKFKVRKRESQKKLQSTEQNLIRLQDIMNEQRRQLDSLERQAQRAERYRVLKEEIRGKDLWLHRMKYEEMHTEAVLLESTVGTSHDEEIAVSTEVESLEASTQSLRTETTEKEAQLQDRQYAYQRMQSDVQEKELSIRELTFTIEQEKKNSEMTGGIVNQYLNRKSVLEKDLVNLTERVEIVSKERISLETDYGTQREQFQSISDRIRILDQDLTDKRRQMFTVAQSESHLDAKLSSFDTQVLEFQERLTESQGIRLELETKRDEFEKRRQRVFGDLETEKSLQKTMADKIANLQNELDQLSGNIKEKKLDEEDLKSELNQVASRLRALEGLQENFEGFEEGVKNIMVWQKSREKEISPDGQVSTVYRPLSEVVDVPSEYEMAFEAGLGSQMQLLFAEGAESCLEGLDYLKANKQGRSSFMPQDLVAAETAVAVNGEKSETLANESGVHGLFSRLMKPQPRFERAVSFLLKDYVLVDSLRTALNLRANYSGFHFVTVDGEVLSSEGVLTGGSQEGSDSGVLKRKREIKELQLRKDELSGKLALLQASLKKLEEERLQLETTLATSKKAIAEKESQIFQLQKELDRAEIELNNVKSAWNRQNEEVSKLEAQLLSRQDQAVDLRDSLLTLREQKQALEAGVSQADAELSAAKSGIGDLQERVTSLQVKLASRKQEEEGLKSQLELVNSSLKETLNQLETMTNESQRSSESASLHSMEVEQLRLDLDKLIHVSEREREELAILRDEFEQKSTLLRESDKKISVLNSQLNTMRSKFSESQLRLEQVKMKEKYIVDQIYERYMVQIAEYAVNSEAGHPENQEEMFGRNLQQLEAEVNELKGKANRMGEVNLSSIQEYEELSQRHNFLQKQHQDLVDAQDQLRKVIDRINRICSKRFKETFDLVNERFTRVFPTLFGGGEARLTLVEDVENSEMGIEIIARPPGKKSQNVTLLSGGEKALTAVSLIFAIFLVKPSPYCLLDEVDAPLDDANVFRFNELVKEMAKRSQIIIVTHNKHTMKVNNRLYGVTMEEKGVSKMVSVSLDQAQKVVAS